MKNHEKQGPFIGPNDASRDNLYKVIGGETSCMKVGDVVRPIKVLEGKWLIGHNYRASLYFNKIDDETAECVSVLTGDLMAKIKRIK